MDFDKRFFSANDKRVEEQLWNDLSDQAKASAGVNQAVKDLACVIYESVPDGRHKSIALTELESVQMRANRGIWAEHQEGR